MPRDEDDIKVTLNKLYSAQQENDKLLARVPMFGERNKILSNKSLSIKAEIRCMEWMLFNKGFNKRLISDEIEDNIKKVYESSRDADDDGSSD